MKNKKDVLIIGNGMLGKAICKALKKKYNVEIWGKKEFSSGRVQLIGYHDFIFITTPFNQVDWICHRLSAWGQSIFFCCSKGINSSYKGSATIFKEYFPEMTSYFLALPIAADFKNGYATLHAPDIEDVARQVVKDLGIKYINFTLFRQPLEIFSAIKNVIAIKANILLIKSKSANEFGVKMDKFLYEVFAKISRASATPSLMQGVPFRRGIMADILATCIGGRNARYGRLRGNGYPKKEALAKIGQIVEGVETAKVLGVKI